MCPVRIERLIRIGVLALGAWCASEAPAGDPVDDALSEAGLADVLEARLLDRLAHTERETEREDLIGRISALYERRLREEPGRIADRDGMVRRAWGFVESMDESRAIGLRLALLLEEYLPIERAAELHELGLLERAERLAHAERLAELHDRFARMARAAGASATIAQRRTVAGSGADEDEETRRRAVRERSLTNYYTGWSGLALAVLREQPPGPDVLRAFGWLLGSEGDLPRLDAVYPGSLEYEHVARSAIGVGRARALSGEWLLAEQWLRLVAESDRAAPDVASQAASRLVRAKADQGLWADALTLVLESRAADGSPMPVTEARYLAMRALTPDAPRVRGDPRDVARIALESLIVRGEIAHVLDLRERYASVSGLLGSGFVGRYADALDRLETAEDAGTPGLYADAAYRLIRAADADDAGRFPLQRDDARLKAAYAEIRAGQARRAIEIARAVLDSPSGPDAEQEAMWLLIVAIDEAADPEQRAELADAVRAYLSRFPGTERASRLLVRHAGSGLLDPEAAAEGLRSIDEDDPIVVDARRTLVRLMYRVWAEGRRADAAGAEEMHRLIRWIWRHQGEGGSGTRWRERLDTDRIAIDVALSMDPADLGMAREAVGRADAALRADPALEVYREELTLRTAEIEGAAGDYRAAAEAADRLRRAASRHASSADRVVLAAAFDRLDARPDDAAAAETAIRIGTRLSGEIIPPAPGRLSADASRVIERIWLLASERSEQDRDRSLEELAVRLAAIVLERGSPTAQGLRETAELAARTNDPSTGLDAWSALLSASKDDEPVWWEARYHTLRLMLEIDPGMARRAYEQHKVLYPMPGLLPWTVRIDELFREDAGHDERPDGDLP